MSTIQLTHSGTTVSLSERLIWTDEFSWNAAETETAYSTTGALLIDVATRQAGRTYTLDGTASAAWMTLELCNLLWSWQSLPGVVFQLLLRGESRDVLFKLFDAKPLLQLIDGEHTPDVLYLPTFQFVGV